MKIAYFAHSKRSYGSESEHKARAFLESRYRVFCPHRDLGETGSIEHYLRVVTWCDLVIALEHEGHIGRGVASEVDKALSLRKEVLVLRGRTLIPVIGIRVVDKDDWAVCYAKVSTYSQRKTHAQVGGQPEVAGQGGEA